MNILRKKSTIRTVLAFVISFFIAVFYSSSNGRDIPLSIQSGFVLAIITTTIVAILSWGIEIAVRKGYPSWLGFLLALILNVFGLVVLAILPNKTPVTK